MLSNVFRSRQIRAPLALRLENMGINIIVYKDRYKRVEKKDWDTLRQWNDRDFPALASDLECERCDDPEDFIFRPKDVNTLRERIKATDWPEGSKARYLKLCDLVEQGNWIYYSV